MKHPAKYTDSLLVPMHELLGNCLTVLDPFGGTGKIFELEKLGKRKITVIEIEPEWANLDPRIILGDALKLPFRCGTFDAICTSPTYGNRMADSFEAQDNSRRNTYHSALGRKPSAGSSATLQWGDAYRDFHTKAWKEAVRVLRDNGVFILNIKDHIRKGVVQNVSDWHRETLVGLGLKQIEIRKISTPSNRFGANAKQRLPFELLIKFQKTTHVNKNPSR